MVPPDTEMDERVAEVTVIVIDPLIEFSFAAATTIPECTLLSSPAALVDAIVESDVDQVTWEVRSAVVPSLYVPLALSCSVAPAATEFVPVWLNTVMELRVLVAPVFCVFDLLVPPPQPERTRQPIKSS